jgi:hypothetical protein
MSLGDFNSSGASFREAMGIYRSHGDIRYLSTLQDYLGCLKNDPATSGDGTRRLLLQQTIKDLESAGAKYHEAMAQAKERVGNNNSSTNSNKKSTTT